MRVPIFYVCAFVYVHVCVCRAYLCLYISFQFFDDCQSIRQLSLEFSNIILVIGTQFFVLVARVQSIRQLFLELRNILFGIGEDLSGVGSLTLVCFH